MHWKAVSSLVCSLFSSRPASLLRRLPLLTSQIPKVQVGPARYCTKCLQPCAPLASSNHTFRGPLLCIRPTRGICGADANNLVHPYRTNHRPPDELLLLRATGFEGSEARVSMETLEGTLLDIQGPCRIGQACEGLLENKEENRIVSKCSIICTTAVEPCPSAPSPPFPEFTLHRLFLFGMVHCLGDFGTVLDS